MFDVKDLSSIKIGLASPDSIRKWSKGEVTKAETINYRTQKPEPDGLYCEKIFGPSKDYECSCGHYKKIRFAGHVCEKCGVEVTSKDVRRERMGHISLHSPCTHIWYLKGIPSRIATLLDIPAKELEEVAYYSGHIVINDCGYDSLKKNTFINESIGRSVFNDALNEVICVCNTVGDNFHDEADTNLINREEYDDEGNFKGYKISDNANANQLINKTNFEKVKKDAIYYRDYNLKANNAFDYENISDFLSQYTGAKFSEGGAAIKSLLSDFTKTKLFYPEDNKKVKGDEKEVGEPYSSTELEEERKKLLIKLKDKDTLKDENKRSKAAKRLEVIESFRNSDNKPEWMVLDALPVIPPDLRPMLQLDGGRFATSDLNDLYRRVITRNNRLKKMMDLGAPNVMLMNEKRMLQESVDALIDNGRRNKPVTGPGGRELKCLSSSLKGKQGRFRQNLLGKRVDYSGRSVIAVGPYLKMYECGIPREMAVQLLRPFIIAELLEKNKITANKQGDNLVSRYDPLVLDVVERIISDHPVLLNRAPTLHRLGIQAFQPRLVDGRAIRLHPLVCTGFNADFDGDQMAVHVPLCKAAQEEALNLMLASNNILGPKDGKPIVTPSQDMVLGNYYLTLEESKEDFLKKAEIYEKNKDFEMADKYRLYAASEGKVFAHVEDLILAYETKQIHLHNRVAILGKCLLKSNFTDDMNESYLLTSVGKVIFNQIFPSDFPYLNSASKDNLDHNIISDFVPRGTNVRKVIAASPLRAPIKKDDLKHIINAIFQRYDRNNNPKTSAVLDKMKDQGFKYSTIAGFTIALSDIHILENKQALLDEGDQKVAHIQEMFEEGLLTEEERHKHVCKTWKTITDQVKSHLQTQFKKDPHNQIYMMSDSGARGNMSNIAQLAGMRGLMGNTSGGEIELPVKRCFREGMTVSEFFIATHGARKGGADTALKTADSGYLTRRLVDVAQDVIVREVDCGTHHGFMVREIRDTAETKNKVIVPLYDRLVGRYALNDVIDPKDPKHVIVKGNTMITEDTAQEIVDAGITEVYIRSLFGCETKDGVCVHCYGRNLATGREVEVGEAVGIMAAQSIGEPGTQLTMRTFHTGGVAGSDITQGLPRVAELFEARNPKGVATISKIAGKVTDTTYENGIWKVTVDNGIEQIVHETEFGAKLRVKKGDTVIAGGKISEGAISPKELLSIANQTAVQVYIIKEVQKVYSGQSIGISDKHIEVIVRQMLKKVVINDAGDTGLITGSRESLTRVTEENQKALLAGKRPAVFTPLILGITKAALETDSFLSAASFQETTRVLTDAAIKGKVDPLHGLKENIITGKLIPAGRGLLSEEQSEKILEEFTVASTMETVKKRYIEEHDKEVSEMNEEFKKTNAQ